MSVRGIRYVIATGEIAGTITSGRTEDLANNADWVLCGIVQVPADHPAVFQPSAWHVRNGGLVRKKLIMLRAERTVFPADGRAEAIIRFEGVEEKTALFVDGIAAANISPEDPVLILTSDVPRTFKVQVVGLFYYSEPLTLEAV